MEDDFYKINRKLFEENSLKKDKLSNFYLNNFYKQIKTQLPFFYDIDVILSQKEVEKNLIQYTSLLNAIGVKIEIEIENNLLLLAKEKAVIYLKKAKDKIAILLRSVTEDIKNYENKNYKSLFSVFYEDVKNHQYIIDCVNTHNCCKQLNLNLVLKILKQNLSYYDSSIKVTQTVINFKNSIFISESAQQWFHNTLEELNAIDINNKAKKGFQAKANAIFNDITCNRIIFKYGVLLKDYIAFLNKTYQAKIKNPDKLSNGINHEKKVEDLIKLYKEN